MSRYIPTFSAARAFEAMARHGNLQGAADELKISPSAVSHQIKALETFLGKKLATRSNAGLTLTKIGKTYAGDLNGVLDQLETVTLRVANEPQSNQLTINIYQSAANLWLVPQLADFYKKHPEIEIKIVTQPEEIDLSGADIDLAIRYQEGCSTSPQNIFLFAEHIWPVCSPDYVEKHGPFSEPGQMLDQPLIVCSSASNEWLDWFKTVGVKTNSFKRMLEVDTRAAAIRAACEGLGFAMGRQPTIRRFLETGRLLTPFPKPVPTGMSYFLLVPDRTILNPGAKKFRSWLVSACRGLAV